MCDQGRCPQRTPSKGAIIIKPTVEKSSEKDIEPCYCEWQRTAVRALTMTVTCLTRQGLVLIPQWGESEELKKHVKCIKSSLLSLSK